MKATDYDAIIKAIDEQEKELRFEHFTPEDAFKLGCMMSQKLYDTNRELAVCIKKLNGAILYQHLTEGTGLDNQRWMNRKCNVVSLTEHASLRFWADHTKGGRTLADLGLDEREYTLGGGGFPVRLKSGELVAVLLASNWPHEQDHQYIVDCLKEYLGKPDVADVIFD